MIPTNGRNSASHSLNKSQALQELMEEETIDFRWRRKKEGSHRHAMKCWVWGIPTTRGGFPERHWIRLRKGKQRGRLLTTAKHELQKPRRKRRTKGWTGVSKGVLRQTNATLWSHWQQRLRRQLITKICGAFMLLGGTYLEIIASQRDQWKTRMGNQYLIQKGRRAGECNILRSSSTYPRPPRLLPDPPDTHPADSDLPIYCSALTKEEIQNAIKQLRNGKAAGPDNIPAEALKVDIKSCSTLLSIRSGKWSGYQQSGRRVTSSSSPRKVISAPASITEV